MSIKFFRKDPIFELKTPLLFAHRGGALEMPESTVMGFNHALNEAKADVLELDVQLTCDGESWYGMVHFWITCVLKGKITAQPKDPGKEEKFIIIIGTN